MIPYVLHVALLISVCLLFYKVLLQKETFYHLNRWVLLACLALTFVLPLLRVPQQWAFRKAPQDINLTTPISAKPETRTQFIEHPEKPQGPVAAAPVKETSVTESATALMPKLLKWALYLYWCGVAAFGLNFLLQVVVLIRQAYKSPAIQDGQFRIVELDTDKAPCSFGSYIFINPAKYDWET